MGKGRNQTELPISTAPSGTPMSLTNARTSSVIIRARLEEDLVQVFKRFDADGDGLVSASELGSIMASLGTPFTEEEVAGMIKDVDEDGDGCITLREFIELNTKGVNSNDVMASLKDAFSVFDINKDGSISPDELLNVFKSLGEECSLGECKKMISGVDSNGDGIISFEEFKVMMMTGSRFDNKI